MTTAPAPKSSSPLKWIFIGCGGLLILALLGFGGCTYFVYRMAKKMQAEFAVAGEAYLRGNPDVAAAFGPVTRVEAAALPERVERHNDRALAVMSFTVAGEKGGGSVRVLFRLSGSNWVPAGAEISGPGGKQSTIGEAIPPPSKSKSFDD